jgi:plasmid replication initiation protein
MLSTAIDLSPIVKQYQQQPLFETVLRPSNIVNYNKIDYTRHYKRGRVVVNLKFQVDLKPDTGDSIECSARIFTTSIPYQQKCYVVDQGFCWIVYKEIEAAYQKPKEQADAKQRIESAKQLKDLAP